MTFNHHLFLKSASKNVELAQLLKRVCGHSKVKKVARKENSKLYLTIFFNIFLIIIYINTKNI